MEKSQDSLIARLSTGDHTAAEELVDIYYKPIYLFMRRLGHNRQTSEDLTQESFLQAWQNISWLRNSKALNEWLYSIACNVSKQYYRKHKRKIATMEGIDLSDISEINSNEVDFHEQLDRLRDAILYLPVKSREVIVLHYMQYLTIAEAAEAVGVGQGTFKSRLNRALKALKKRIISEGGEL